MARAADRSETDPLLLAEQVGKDFGHFAAVEQVSLAVRRGELKAIIGPNGAGKTTLFNMLSGEIKPTAGRIELLGREVTREPAWRMTGLGIGRSFQRINIFASLTVLENVRLAVQAVSARPRRLLHDASRATDLMAKAEQALQRIGLAEVAARHAATLSHGEQRQLEIAMALASNPKVLLLDEPLAGMGPEESQRMTALLKDLAREHALLLIEHDMDFVFTVADWMTVMAEGTVLAEGRPAAIRANTAVQDAYLGGHA